MTIRSGAMKSRNVMPLLAVFALLVCSAISLAQSGPAKHVSKSVTVQIEAVGSTIRTGSAVDVKIRVTNASNRDLILSGTDYRAVDWSFLYLCEDEAGQTVAKNTSFLGGVGDHSVTIVRSGDSYGELVPVDQACNLLKPGRYTIQLALSDSADSTHDVVKSNRITIMVLPNQPDVPH
jgi:hypothetical protein